jgi:putative ABC transport system ATP-binding protein
MSEIIRLEGVWKIYGKPPSETVALSDVSLQVRRGEFFGVVGPSGSGKSTMLHLIGGLDRPTKGRIIVDGSEITSMRSDPELSAYRNRTVGFVFQLFYLVPRLKVLENVELPLIKRGLPRSERKSLALEALKVVGIDHLAYKYPTQLSGGEQQRVAIARAIVARPKILLADEPMGNLDAASSKTVMETFKRLNRELGMTVVVVTHNLELIWSCSRVARMYSGRLAGIYTPESYNELIASFIKKS